MDLPDSTDSKYSVGSFPRLLLFARSKQLSGLSTDNHSSSISPRVRGSFYDFEVRSTAALSHESETSQTASVAAGAAAAAAAAAPAYSVGAGTVNLEAAQPRDDKPRTEGVTFLGRFLMMYCDALDKRPVFTKSISSGLIGLLGDLLAQTVGWGIGDGQIPWNGTRALWRSCAVMLDGFFINGPLLHYCYEFLEKHMPAGDSIRASVFQVAVDVFIIDPVFAFIFVWSTGLIEGRSVKNGILHVLEHSYPEMVLWLVVIGLVWAPLQVYLFNRYPVQFRVLTADIIDLVWTCVSSFFSHAR